MRVLVCLSLIILQTLGTASAWAADNTQPDLPEPTADLAGPSNADLTIANPNLEANVEASRDSSVEKESVAKESVSKDSVSKDSVSKDSTCKAESLKGKSNLLAANPDSASSKSTLPAATNEKLQRLECKFFGHCFEQDRIEDRASRLEQLILGEDGTGSAIERVTKLVSLYTDEELAPPPPPKPVKVAAKPVSKSTMKPDGSTVNSANAATPKFGTANSETNNASGSLSYEEENELRDYPRITALENAILGRSFEKDPLSGRLAKLETAAFGSPSNLPDFGQRSDALQSYCEKTLHKKVVASSGQLHQLEKPGMRSSGQNVAAANGATGGGSSNGAPAGQGISKAAVLATVANTLLGVSGFGGLGMLPAAAMGLARGGSNQNRPVKQDAVIAQTEDDFTAGPMVEANEPPPAEAKLLTKVSWCEQRVYGQTYPTMHLTDRLRQLSQELQVSAGKSDFELMDDIGDLIKSVQLRQKSRPIGSAPETTVQ